MHCRLARASFSEWPQRPVAKPVGPQADMYLGILMAKPELFREFLYVIRYFIEHRGR